MSLKLKQPTAKGYVVVPPFSVFDGGYTSSKTRRGRIQGGGSICPTICANNNLYVYEGEIIQIGNLLQPRKGFANPQEGRVYLPNGLGMTLRNDSRYWLLIVLEE